MRIGIFGDSYADPNPYPDESWISYLKNNIETANIDQYSRSGTSHWWSYQKFIQTYKDYDIIIFCHTNPMRWPHLPKEHEGNEWNIGHMMYGGRGNLQDHINKFFQFIFTDELLQFHCASIFRKVNEICQKENIFLINLLMETTETLGPEYSYQINKSPFSTFMGLDELSRWEKVIVSDKVYPTVELLYKYKINNDVRANHLSATNNSLLGKLLLSTMENKEYTHNTTLMSLDVWEEFSEISAERIMIRMENS
jgi:hypothetical protein